jgi:Na+-driven multidrug efflux pump
MLVPTILMNAVTCISSAADTIIVGNFLGENSLAAITFSTPVYMIVNTIAALIAVGGTTVMSIAGGRGDKREADEIFSLTIISCVFASLVIAVLGALFIYPVVKILGARGELTELTREYAEVVFYLTPALIINITLAFLVRCDGRPNLAMAGMFISIIANIVLDLIFIIPFKMGVAGAAWGTGVSQAISALILATHYLSKRNTQVFVRPSFVRILSIFKGGAGTSLHFIYQFIAILFFNNFIMRMAGGNGIVVYTVILNVSMIAMSIFEGLSQTVQPMFAVYYGENNNESSIMTYKLSLAATIILGGLATLILELFP